MLKEEWKDDKTKATTADIREFLNTIHELSEYAGSVARRARKALKMGDRETTVSRKDES